MTEIDLRIKSVPLRSQTRKLRAKWSNELHQDLNAYNMMDDSYKGDLVLKYREDNYLYDPTVYTAIGEPLGIDPEDYRYGY